VSPPTASLGRVLRDLLRYAAAKLGDKAAAGNWVFTPNSELGGITPAEAVQYKGYATGAPALLDQEIARHNDEEPDNDVPQRVMPVVIERGHSPASEAA